ncbi:hypothetical protein AGMMS50230_22520 [Spirochaetia bacterium]|nr:hypothetical protein AGMMS50230_22520 [Spirochaetia bacterium]
MRLPALKPPPAQQVLGYSTPRRINDIWIAAQTIETGSKLVTPDTHFKNIGGLRVLLLSDK